MLCLLIRLLHQQYEINPDQHYDRKKTKKKQTTVETRASTQTAGACHLQEVSLPMIYSFNFIQGKKGKGTLYKALIN